MRLFIISFFTFCTLPVFSQIKISGKLTDGRQNPLSGASISIKNSYDGTTTDSSGHFIISTTEKGTQSLVATISGYNSYEKSFTLDRNIEVNISLKELITELKAVVLSAGSFEASDQKKATILNSIDIVTTASANADITSAIKTLPGAQQVGEEEGLFVRGGTSNESKTFIDGTLVNNFYYSSEPGLAQRGRFNPFIFKGTIFSSGGYSALHGQALSSVLILESIDLPEKSSGQVSLSYLGVGGGVQHLSKDKKISWGVTYNYTDLKFAFKIIRQRPDYFKVPVLHNADANFRIKTNGGMIKYYGMIGSTDAGLRYADIDSIGMKNGFALKNLNNYHNISWKENLGNGYKLASGFSYSTNKDDIEGSFLNNENDKVFPFEPRNLFKNFELSAKGEYFNLKAVVEKKLKGLKAIRVGTEINHSNDKGQFTDYAGNVGTDTVIETIVSAFGETDIYLTNNLAAKIGVRTEHSELIDKWNIAPRFSLAYKLAGKGQLSFAYGIFYQGPDKKYLPTSNPLRFSEANQYIIQYQKVTSARTFRSEVFYKKYRSLYKSSTIGRPVITNNEGFGYAKGLEFFWRDKKTIKNLDYWVSYSYYFINCYLLF
jgi:hypothetical protein